jgi:all-trans-retinol 13,14-reductase
MKYDVVIIGSGLGGLQCGYILSLEGYNVCILEKNSQLGGCLQTFSRKGSVFDTGMHYIGSMDEGQILAELFRYFKLTGRLKLKRMDESGYDVIRYDDSEYKFAMGYERFRDTMISYFPGEREAIIKYTSKLMEISSSLALSNFSDNDKRQTSYFDYFSTGIGNYLENLTNNENLKNVLTGLSPLYAGVKDKTPLYIPLTIHSSFINSAYRFIGGGSQISDLLEEYIKANGGTILRRAEVTDMVFESGKLNAVKVNNSEVIEAKTFISNIHPATLLKIAPNAPLRPAYRNRIQSIAETCGVFTLYLSMKEKKAKYINNNYYVFKARNIWNAYSYTDKDWPYGYMMHFSPEVADEEYTRSIIINTYMRWDDVSKWKDTYVEHRGDEYREFKKIKAEKLLDLVELDFPGIRNDIKGYYTSTPLTYRDYIGTPTGSIYGQQKDFNEPLRTMVTPRTSIPNLLHTGQNINIHGVVGVTICSVLTCSELLGTKYLIDKIKNS